MDLNYFYGLPKEGRKMKTNRYKFTDWELIHNRCDECGGKVYAKRIMSRDHLIKCDGCERSMLIKEPPDKYTTNYLV